MSQYELPEQIDQQYNKLLQQFLDGKSVSSSINVTTTKKPATSCHFNTFKYSILVYLSNYFAADLTEKGFAMRQGILWKEYKEHLAAEGKQPIRKTIPMPIPVIENNNNVEIPPQRDVQNSQLRDPQERYDQQPGQPQNEKVNVQQWQQPIQQQVQENEQIIDAQKRSDQENKRVNEQQPLQNMQQQNQDINGQQWQQQPVLQQNQEVE